MSKIKHLSLRERKFLRGWFAGMYLVDAYTEAIRKPDGTVPVQRNSAAVAASQMMSRLRRSPAAWQNILAAADLDDYTLALKLRELLNAKRTEFYQGEAVADVEDNGTQARMVELLSEILGHRKQALELSGALGIKGYVGVSPDDWPAPGEQTPPVPAEQDPDPEGADG